MDIDDLINDMGTMHMEQQATLQIAQHNAQMAQSFYEEELRRQEDWFHHFYPP